MGYDDKWTIHNERMVFVMMSSQLYDREVALEAYLAYQIPSQGQILHLMRAVPLRTTLGEGA